MMREVRALGIVLALLNVLLWYCVPAIRATVDALAARKLFPDNPVVLYGVQELLVYFDPWLARGVFPVVYTLGLAVIPFLAKTAPDQSGPNTDRAWSIAVTLLLLGFEAVWLFLIAVGVFLRGLDWNLYWPSERWDQPKLVPLNLANLSEYVWFHWMNRSVEGMPWVLREIPGLALMGAYFLAGFVLAGLLSRTSHRTTPHWRWVVLLLIVQVAALVPMKMLLRWVFSIQYVIIIPEYGVNV